MNIILLILKSVPIQLVSSVGICFLLPYLGIQFLSILGLKGYAPSK